MGTLVMMIEVQETLKRKLQAVKADFDPLWIGYELLRHFYQVR